VVGGGLAGGGPGRLQGGGLAGKWVGSGPPVLSVYGNMKKPFTG
jgi:hypothetical protein